ncbi:hypothetical protein, partial [Parasutterella excrementihominis]
QADFDQPAFFLQFIQPLPQKEAGKKGSEDVVGREKTVGPRPAEKLNRILNQAHPRRNAVAAQNIPPAIGGVREAFDCTEQKQSAGQPAKLRKKQRNPSGKIKEIMNVIQHHQDHGQTFQIKSAQSAEFFLDFIEIPPFLSEHKPQV